MASIDGKAYQERTSIVCSRGSGDSKEEFTFRVLLSPEGVECWLLTENSKWWLFRRPAQPVSFKVVKTHEEFQAQKFVRDGQDLGEKRLAWVTFDRAYSEALPFQSTTEGMLIDGSDMLISVPLMQDKEEFFSPSFPASGMTRSIITPRSGLGGDGLAKHVGLALAALFLAAAFLKTAVPIKALWWLGPLAILSRAASTRQSLWDHLLRFVGGVFFLHFVTHALDNLWTNDWDEAAVPLFESAKIGAMCLLLWVVRLWKPRIYFAFLDGATVSGGCSWLVFCSGLALVCMAEEDNYFKWFSWYAGESFWGMLWLLAGICGIAYKIHDYRRVPLDLRGFRSLLYRTADALNLDLGVCCNKSGCLVEWADDLEDALAISAHPLVASLADYAPDFEAWRGQASKLAEVDPEQLTARQREHLAADLATIGADFRDLISCLDQWPESKDQLKEIRISPMLGTWGQ